MGFRFSLEDLFVEFGDTWLVIDSLILLLRHLRVLIPVGFKVQVGHQEMGRLG